MAAVLQRMGLTDTAEGLRVDPQRDEVVRRARRADRRVRLIPIPAHPERPHLEALVAEVDRYRRLDNQTSRQQADELGVHPATLTRFRQGKPLPEEARIRLVAKHPGLGSFLRRADQEAAALKAAELEYQARVRRASA